MVNTDLDYCALKLYADLDLYSQPLPSLVYKTVHLLHSYGFVLVNEMTIDLIEFGSIFVIFICKRSVTILLIAGQRWQDLPLLGGGEKPHKV